jgi:hypothetical protein
MLLPKPSLLITECADEFDALRDALEREIKPRGIIEQMYVDDISCIVWEILRLRRCKTIIINSNFRAALEHLIVQLLREPGQYSHEIRPTAEDLAQRWFADAEARKQVSEILNRFHLDESAIEAEAIRQSCSDIDSLDRMLNSLESRRDKSLRCVAEYRESLGRQLRESTDRIIEGKDILTLQDASNKKSAAA